MRDKLSIHNNEMAIEFSEAGFKGSRRRSLKKTGVRVAQQGKIQMASFFGDVDENELYARCEKNSHLALPYEAEFHRESQKEKSHLSPQLNMDFLRSQVEKMISKMTSDFPGFTFKARMKADETVNHFCNDLGVEQSAKYNSVNVMAEVRVPMSENILDMFLFLNGAGDFDVSEQIEKNRTQLSNYQNITPIQPGRHKVLFLNSADLLSRASWTDSFLVKNYEMGSSLFSGKRGETIFNSRVHLMDSPYRPEDLQFGPMDGEGGWREESLSLVKEGVFVGLLSDLNNAKKYGVESTANGIRTYNTSPRLAFSNLHFATGSRSLDQLIADLDEAVLINMAFGGQFTESGAFSTPVQLAYKVEGGKVVGRTQPLAMDSSIQKMLGEDFVETTKDCFYGDSHPALLSWVNFQEY